MFAVSLHLPSFQSQDTCPNLELGQVSVPIWHFLKRTVLAMSWEGHRTHISVIQDGLEYSALVNYKCMYHDNAFVNLVIVHTVILWKAVQFY